MIEIRTAENEEEDQDALNEEGFEMLKNIIKELIFSGTSRDVKNDDGDTAKDIFEKNLSIFDEAEIKKVRYILTKPKRFQCLRTTRPIEKVDRNRKTQVTAMVVDALVLLAFVIVATYS
jgi:hypothetical protein